MFGHAVGQPARHDHGKQRAVGDGDECDGAEDPVRNPDPRRGDDGQQRTRRLGQLARRQSSGAGNPHQNVDDARGDERPEQCHRVDRARLADLLGDVRRRLEADKRVVSDDRPAEDRERGHRTVGELVDAADIAAATAEHHRDRDDHSEQPALLLGQTLAHIACVAILQEHTPTPMSVWPRLQRAIASRIVVEQAKGFVHERLDVPVPAAFALLREYALERGDHLTAVARRLINEPAARPAILDRMSRISLT